LLNKDQQDALFFLKFFEQSILCIAHLRQECQNSKSSIFELLVSKETFADALLTGTV
jgi:hypothetical protein